MSDHYWLSKEQLARIEPYFPLSHGVPRVDDRRVLSRIIHVLKRGLQWCPSVDPALLKDREACYAAMAA